MKVLSLFEGISCARVALQRACLPVELYLASEIDKTAIEISKRNWPDIQHIGDVRDVKGHTDIDLLIGGSPCQDLSVAKTNRQGLKGDRSGLFYEYLRILRETKPRWFILENVASMPKADRDEITREMGVEPIMIDAALVSAQNRKRLFWTNIPNVHQPMDRKILLRDVLEDIPTPPDSLEIKDKSKTIRVGGHGSKVGDRHEWDSVYRKKPMQIGNRGNVNGMATRIYSAEGKSVTLKANGGGGGAKTGLYLIGRPRGKNKGYLSSEKASTLTGSSWEHNNHIAMLTEKRTEEAKRIRREHQKKGRDYSPRRAKELAPRTDDKANTITTGLTKETLLLTPEGIRNLTPVECERLQSLPDGYTEGASKTARITTLGNAFNVEVIAHILSFIPSDAPEGATMKKDALKRSIRV